MAERLQWARRWAALLGLPTWQQPEQEPQPQPSSQALWQQQAAMHAEPLGSMPAGRPAARRLSQSSGLVTVALLPSADNGTVVVDGYSGLARALNSSQQLPPVCGADGAPPPGYPADVACLGSLVLRTAGTQVTLLLSLGDGAVLPANVLPADALSISGNASLIGVTRGAGTLSNAAAEWPCFWRAAGVGMTRFSACQFMRCSDLCCWRRGPAIRCTLVHPERSVPLSACLATPACRRALADGAAAGGRHRSHLSGGTGGRAGAVRYRQRRLQPCHHRARQHPACGEARSRGARRCGEWAAGRTSQRFVCACVGGRVAGRKGGW